MRQVHEYLFGSKIRSLRVSCGISLKSLSSLPKTDPRNIDSLPFMLTPLESPGILLK
jgi:hypothetical protein